MRKWSDKSNFGGEIISARTRNILGWWEGVELVRAAAVKCRGVFHPRRNCACCISACVAALSHLWSAFGPLDAPSSTRTHARVVRR